MDTIPAYPDFLGDHFVLCGKILFPALTKLAGVYPFL